MVEEELGGWTLLAVDLALEPDIPSTLAALRVGAVEQARERFSLATLSSSPVVFALRRLFRTAGCDPTRYRPSSEALLRRALKGGELPEIHPFVDVCNVFSMRLAVPCCVMAAGSFEPPFRLRRGRPGETYPSLRGVLKLDGKPLLVDARGPCDTPISGSQRVKVREETTKCTLVAYLPAAEVSIAEADDVLRFLLGEGTGVRATSPCRELRS